MARGLRLVSSQKRLRSAEHRTGVQMPPCRWLEGLRGLIFPDTYIDDESPPARIFNTNQFRIAPPDISVCISICASHLCRQPAQLPLSPPSHPASRSSRARTFKLADLNDKAVSVRGVIGSVGKPTYHRSRLGGELRIDAAGALFTAACRPAPTLDQRLHTAHGPTKIRNWEWH